MPGITTRQGWGHVGASLNSTLEYLAVAVAGGTIRRVTHLSASMFVGGQSGVGVPLMAQVVWDPVLLAPGATTGVTVPCPGAIVGDVVAVGFSGNVPNPLLTWSGYVPLANFVNVILTNHEAVNINLLSGTATVLVWHPFTGGVFFQQGVFFRVAVLAGPPLALGSPQPLAGQLFSLQTALDPGALGWRVILDRTIPVSPEGGIEINWEDPPRIDPGEVVTALCSGAIDLAVTGAVVNTAQTKLALWGFQEAPDGGAGDALTVNKLHLR